MPGRRSFLIGCGSMVALPILGNAGSSRASRVAPPDQPAGGAGQPEFSGSSDVPFRLDGWDSPADSESARDDRPFIWISSSWQAAWR